MAIRFACACGKAVSIADEHAGRKAKCPSCGRILTVPRRSSPPGNKSGEPPDGKSTCVVCGEAVASESLASKEPTICRDCQPDRTPPPPPPPAPCYFCGDKPSERDYLIRVGFVKPWGPGKKAAACVFGPLGSLVGNAVSPDEVRVFDIPRCSGCRLYHDQCTAEDSRNQLRFGLPIIGILTVLSAVVIVCTDVSLTWVSVLVCIGVIIVGAVVGISIGDSERKKANAKDVRAFSRFKTHPEVTAFQTVHATWQMQWSDKNPPAG